MVELLYVGIACTLVILVVYPVARLGEQWLRLKRTEQRSFHAMPICFTLHITDPTVPRTIRYWIDE